MDGRAIADDGLRALRALRGKTEPGIGRAIRTVSDYLGLGPATPVENACRAFYDEQLLTRIDVPDPGDSFYAALSSSISRADRSFERLVDKDEFRRELTALRLELFGLTLTHRVGWRREELCLKEIVWTKRYLEERGEGRTWAAMADYNKAIAEAGFRRTLHSSLHARQLIRMRVSLNESKDQSVASDCLQHYVNLYNSEATWRRGRALTALIQTLAERLDFQVNAEAQMRLQSLLHVFYDEAAQRLRSLRLV